MKEIRTQSWIALILVLPALFSLGGLVCDLIFHTDILGMTGLTSSVWNLGAVMIALPSLALMITQLARDKNAITRLVNFGLTIVILSDMVFFIAACVKAV